MMKIEIADLEMCVPHMVLSKSNSMRIFFICVRSSGAYTGFTVVLTQAVYNVAHKWAIFVSRCIEKEVQISSVPEEYCIINRSRLSPHDCMYNT